MMMLVWELAADGDSSPVQKTTQNGHHQQVEVKEIITFLA